MPFVIIDSVGKPLRDVAGDLIVLALREEAARWTTTLEALPSANSTRWVIRRKAEVVSAVNGGLLSIDEACERYGLTAEEFASWQHAVDQSGIQGLRVTRIRYYRDLYRRGQALRSAAHCSRTCAA